MDFSTDVHVSGSNSFDLASIASSVAMRSRSSITSGSIDSSVSHSSIGGSMFSTVATRSFIAATSHCSG